MKKLNLTNNIIDDQERMKELAEKYSCHVSDTEAPGFVLFEDL